jgi:hypothetical protein
MADLYIKLIPEGDLRIKTIAVEDCEPYVDCDKSDSIASILKLLVVTLPDGTLALQIFYL